ncbi:Bcr/CflA family efflux MFS transporter [Acinetobacter nematophilus]|uniref:Bcr/CflA family efflux MFS transporter n=1 Tax=Acinetobacter nematophilus TaxID=2994642 RepID=UPI003AF70520
MLKKSIFCLLAVLMMFPQVVETIYSPALPHIAYGFHISAEKASQTISLYFIAFALGIVFWGQMCDILGRRNSILGGLLIYAIGSIAAIFCSTFDDLIIARILSAFGAAVGSIGTQTIIRDIFKAKELVKIFSVIGILLALSPVLGMVLGAFITTGWGYQGVFLGLALFSIILMCWCVVDLPETLVKKRKKVPICHTFIVMLKDGDIWKTAFLVALFNMNLFAYYQLSPFYFQRLQASSWLFGLSGLCLTFGSVLGALLNKSLLNKDINPRILVSIAALIAILGSVLICISLAMKSWLFIFPALLIMVAYGLAIPNLLATALKHYPECLGTAGALLGLMYYLLLGGGLILAGWVQNLSAVLLICSVAALCINLFRHREV